MQTIMKVKPGTSKQVREALAMAGAIHVEWLKGDWERRISDKLDGYWQANMTTHKIAEAYRVLLAAGPTCVTFVPKFI